MIQTNATFIEGNKHTLVLTENGQIYCCGSNFYINCGIVGEDEVKSLTRLDIKHKIVDIAVGESHNLCLTDKGKLYAFGDNDYQQLGMTQPGQSTVVKSKFFWDNDIKLIDINAGGWHNICIDDKGNCWGFGWSEYAQLGVDKEYNPPTKIKIGEAGCEIDRISLGPWHSLFLSKDNEIYTCGYNENGECSVNDKREKLHPIYNLKRNEIGIDKDCRIAAVIAGYQSTLIVVES